MTPQAAPIQTYVSEYDAILRTMQGYLDGVREGRSELMRPVFHPAATFFGHYPGGVMNGPIQPLFDWVDQNGPASDVEFRIATKFDAYRRGLDNHTESISLAHVNADVESATPKPNWLSPVRLEAPGLASLEFSGGRIGASNTAVAFHSLGLNSPIQLGNFWFLPFFADAQVNSARSWTSFADDTG